MAAKGKKLFFAQLGGEQPIPPEFVAAMERAEEIQPLGEIVTGPESLSDTIVESKTETNRTNERVRRTVKKKAGNVTLNTISENEKGQPVQITRVLYRTSVPPTDVPPSDTTKVSVKDLGNGFSIREVAVAGTYSSGTVTAALFPGTMNETRQAITLPDKFKQSGATLAITAATSAGVVATTTALGSGGTGIIDSKAQRVDPFTVRLENTTLTASTNSSVTEYALRDGQLVTVATSYVADNATEPTVSATTEIIEREVIGGGKAIQRVGNVSALFTQNASGHKQMVVVPDKFRPEGMTLTTASAVSATTTATPTALGSGGTGVVESNAQRIDATKVRIESTTLTGSVDTSVNEYALRDGQVVTVVTSYVNESAGAPTASATTEIIEREVIGGGKAIERVGNVSAVFPRNASGHKQMVVVPEKFRTGMTLTTTGVTSQGTTATPAALGSGGTGVVESNAQRVDATKVRVETTTLSGSVDVSVTEYGYVEGLVAPITTTLVAEGDGASSGGLLVTNVQREVIGEGKAVNKVEGVASWPTRYGQDYNARFNVVIPWQETTISPAASGTASTEIRPVDFARQRNRTYNFANITAAYAASVITFPGKFTVDLPNVLKKVAVTYNRSVGYGANNHPTSKQYVSWTNKGSYTVAPTSTSQGSASIIADVTYEIEYYQGISVNCEHHYFYLTSTATLAQILTKTGAKSLPAFRPKSSQINVYGGQVSLQQSADSRISGAPESYSSVSGDGFSTEVGVSSKVITIPPTIHGELLVSGDHKKTATVTVSVSANITRPIYQAKPGTTNGTPDFSVPPTQVGLFNTPSPRSEKVEAGVTPTSLSATSPSSIPTSGKYLVACSGEPVDYGFTLIHAVVVDFAQYG